ncbi:hypothetical protein E2562_025082 [Oryza meyeriana var. granulata]|uniref:Uncharacterized protein n=1 Tax=Oryza meyeriana var. granulata TaxID=110450 RepID=A0A6G1D7X9_9ORYZ|nr:hypothetical protein E2562_025082 [Oryza meyeriana var. granulata]
MAYTLPSVLQQEPRTDDAIIGKRREDQGRTPCYGLQIAEGRRQSRRAGDGTAERQNRRRTQKTIRRMRVGAWLLGPCIGIFHAVMGSWPHGLALGRARPLRAPPVSAPEYLYERQVIALVT